MRVPKDYDIIIVGSGPAGSAAAVTARRHGLRTALVDKSAFPRDKLCGGGFTERSRKEMKAIFGRDIDPELFHTCHRVRFTAGAETLGDVDDAPPLHMTMRRDFDTMLHDRAVEAGAEPWLRARIAALDTEARTLTLTSGEILGFRILIGADGVNSFVARTLFGRPFDPKRIGFCLEVEAPPRPEKPADRVEIDFRATHWGYGWVFPKAQSLTLGVGGINVKNRDMKANLSGYLAQHGVDAAALKFKGQFIPAGDFRKVPGRGCVLLAGDAAGLVDPITGEGIAHAMSSGAAAAEAAAVALRAGRPETALGDYRARIAPLHEQIRLARRFRTAVFPSAVHDRFLRIVAARPEMQRRFLKLLAGETDYTDIRRFFFLRMLRRAVLTTIYGRRAA